MDSIFSTRAGEPVPSWYYSVDGVLNTDTYSLYPYEKRNITVGFSIFGELIDNLRNNSLNYGGVKVFSPADPSIPKEIWYQGWLINITYYNGILGQWRNVWATAVFADPLGFTAFGGNWLRVQFPQDCMANAAQLLNLEILEQRVLQGVKIQLTRVIYMTQIP